MTHGFERKDSYSWQSGETGDINSDFSCYSFLKGDEHDSTDRGHCKNYGGNETPVNGRQDTRMEVTITFTGYINNGGPGCQECAGMGCSECQVVIIKKITQDDIDEIRQEYLDMDRLVPSRSEFTDAIVVFNHGYYDLMIDEGLAGYRQAWVTACNERNGTSYTTADFHVNSGYRNPHHNDYHAGSTAAHSLHQYGVALDILTVDADGDGVDIDIDNDELIGILNT